MNTQPQSSKSYFGTLKLIFFSNLFWPLLIFFILYTNELDFGDDKDFASTMLYLSLGSAFIGVGGAYFFKSFFLKKINEKDELKSKMSKLRTILIIMFGFLEVPMIISLIAYISGATYMVLSITLLAVLVLAMHYPSRALAIRMLKLDKTDKQLINDPKAIISETTRKS